jgi:3-hydroxy-5-methyl-1-naphthoate 3-O-methyltransferase
MSKEKNISLLRKAYDSLPEREGGTIMINEWFLNNDKTGPTLPALMGLNMILETSEGRSYSFAEIYEMLTEAGFAGIEKKPILGSAGHIILGYREPRTYK